MIKTILCINEKAVDSDNQSKPSISIGFLGARLIFFGAGMLTGNMVEPFDRLRRGAGKPQLDKKETATPLAFNSTPQKRELA